MRRSLPWLAALVLACAACSGSPDSGGVDIVKQKKDWGCWTDGECVVPEGEAPDYTPSYGCQADFDALASRPLDGSIPGARSSKTVIDTLDHDALYFLNAEKYPMHYEFCFDYLSGQGKPPVAETGEFSSTEYYSPHRRFLLGAITFYQEPGIWTYEIAPYDTATAEMVAKSYDIVRQEVFFGDILYFHPTSELVEILLPDLPEQVKVVTTDELFQGVTFLPLNPGETIGRLRFLKVAELEGGETFVMPWDIAVLDKIPNDIAVVAGIITGELQTPLSHINVLSQNRGTPNMSLLGAMSNDHLRSLEGEWVRLEVNPFDYSVVKVSKKEADEWLEEHKPPPVTIPELDLTITDLRDLDLPEDDPNHVTLENIPAFGGKASHYALLSRIGEDVPVPKAFAIPVCYYRQFEEQNGFDELLDELLAHDRFRNDIEFREDALEALRTDMKNGELDLDFKEMVLVKLAHDYPGIRTRFRSSTNAEDLDGFTGAGLYTSKSGDPNDEKRPVEDAIRKVYASLWNFRAYEEREYRGIDHRGVGMALLVHRSFPAEDANGVALTNNIFDTTQPAFYINVQVGDFSVVKPMPGLSTDQFLYYYLSPNKPITFLGHSNLVPKGETVLTHDQTRALGKALFAIRKEFVQYYMKAGKFYAMDVEFKFNTDVDQSVLWVKQARPHYGWAGGGE